MWILALAILTSSAEKDLSFEKDVWPILDSKCLSCHGAPRQVNGRLKKPKGGLRLDNRLSILSGGNIGEVVIPGDSEASLLYTLTVLEASDPDIMPAKGDPLSAKEAETLRRWIDEGASFGDWTGDTDLGEAIEGDDSQAPKVPAIVAIYRGLNKGLAILPQSQVDKASESTASISRVLPDGPLLRVAFVRDRLEVTDKHLSALAPVQRYVAHLDASRTKITDDSLKKIAQMKNLVRLDLHETGITDRGLSQLKDLKELRTLNLYGTSITDKSLDLLAELPHLQSVYLWRSDVSERGVERLRSACPDAKISFERVLPEIRADEGEDQERGRGRRRRK